jgi:hypothetical protein
VTTPLPELHSPAMARMRELLPIPLLPTTKRRSPDATSSEQSRRSLRGGPLRVFMLHLRLRLDFVAYMLVHTCVYMIVCLCVGIYFAREHCACGFLYASVCMCLCTCSVYECGNMYIYCVCTHTHTHTHTLNTSIYLYRYDFASLDVNIVRYKHTNVCMCARSVPKCKKSMIASAQGIHDTHGVSQLRKHPYS